MQETWVWSLGQEDPLEEDMATHSSILNWKIPWTEGPGKFPKSRTQLSRHVSFNIIIFSNWWEYQTTLPVSWEKHLLLMLSRFSRFRLCATPVSALLMIPKPLTGWITTNWKILKEKGIPDHLTCLLRNLCASQEATVRTRHGTMDWFKIGKGVHQGCILSPCLYYIQNTSCEMSDWMKYKLESSLLGEISITLDMQTTPPLWQKAKRN